MSSKTFLESFHQEIATSCAAFTILPFYYPFLVRSFFYRARLVSSMLMCRGGFPHYELPMSRKPLDGVSFFAKNYRGIFGNCFMIQPLYPAAEWVVRTLLEKIQDIQQRAPNLAEKIIAGFIAGGATVSLVNPWETVTINAQRHQGSCWQAFGRILRESGPEGFYTGAIPMIIRNGIFSSGLLVTTPELAKKLDKIIPGADFKHRLLKTTLGATIPATLFTAISIPFDLAAVGRQTDYAAIKFDSAFETLSKIYNKHGIRAIKVGLLLRLASTLIEMTGFSILNEQYQQALAPTKFYL